MTSISCPFDWLIRQDIWLLSDQLLFSFQSIVLIMSSTYMVFRCVFTVINMCFFVRYQRAFFLFKNLKKSFFFWNSGIGFCSCSLQLVVTCKILGLSSIDGQSAVHSAYRSDNLRFDCCMKSFNWLRIRFSSDNLNATRCYRMCRCLVWKENFAFHRKFSKNKHRVTILDHLSLKYIITMIIVFVVLLLGVVVVIAFNEKVTINRDWIRSLFVTFVSGGNDSSRRIIRKYS